MHDLQAEIINIVALVIASLLGIVAKQVTSFLKKKGIVAQIESHKELANMVVKGIEQTYNHLNGEEKLNVAKIEIINIAKAKGIKISEKELDMLIESSVKEMNKAVKEELKK
jgi:LL-H family phage holin